MIVHLKPETEAAIRTRAHQIWEEEGCPHGRDEIHWQKAYEVIVHVELMTPASKVAADVADDAVLNEGAGTRITKAPRAKAKTAKK